MRVGELGRLLVQVDEREVPLCGQRLWDVLMVLLQRRVRPVPAEVVLDLVWGQAAGGLDAVFGDPRTKPELLPILRAWPLRVGR